MELTLLGTGSILTDRLSACAIIDSCILVDVPNGSVKTARRAGFPPSEFDICLVTHFHADHFFDCVFLLLELGLRQVRSRPFYFVGPTGLEDRVRSLFTSSYPESLDKVFQNSAVEFVEIDETGAKLKLYDYGIEAVEVRHKTARALGYLVRKDGRAVAFSGDSELCPGVEYLCGSSECAVLDASFLQPRSGHMGVSDTVELAAKYPSCRIIATHTTDEVFELGDAPFRVGRDGDIFEVGVKS